MFRSQPPPWPLAVMRSSQLDALRLDDELAAMIQEQLVQVFKHFTPVGLDQGGQPPFPTPPTTPACD